MKQLKFAIIGCGRIAERHAEHINNIGKLIAACDIVELRAKVLADKYNANYYTNYTDLLKKETAVDVVAVCTPNGLHALHSIDALDAGYNVICEKPMAIQVSDCRAMIEAATRNNKKLFAIKQNRFNPPVQAVKKAIDNNVLGKIYSIQLSCFWNRNADYYANSWKGTKDLDGGTLFTQFSHFIDLIYWMIGDVKKVYALSANAAHKGITEFEDCGVIAVEFVNGAIGTINYTVNSYEKNMEGSLTIFAEKGTVKIGGQYLNELEYANVENFKFENLPEGNVANNYGTYTGSMSNHDKVYENVVAVLNGNAEIAASAEDALKTVEIIEKIYASANVLNKE